jgi:hypothetical protein
LIRSYKHGNEPLGYIIDEEILNEVVIYELAMKDPAAWNYLLLLIHPVNTQKRENFWCSVFECWKVVVEFFFIFPIIWEEI